MRKILFFIVCCMILLIASLNYISADYIFQNSTESDLVTISGTTGNLTVSGFISTSLNATASWFKGLFNWVIKNGASSLYLIFNGSTLEFNESQLNSTIDIRAAAASTNISELWGYNYSGDSFIPLAVTSDGALRLSLSAISGVPSGAIMAFNLETCPNGWILADGSSGTPDLRGIFVRGSGTSGVLKWANGTYINAGIGTYGNDKFQAHWHAVNMQLYNTPNSGVNQFASGANVYRTPVYAVDAISAGASTGTPRTGAETSPAYYATIYCVKTGEDTPVSNSIWGVSGNNVFVQNTSKNLNLLNTTTTYYAPNASEESIGTLHFIPSANRPSAYVLNSGSATTFTDVDFGAYVPTGVKALLLLYDVKFLGDGARDAGAASFRANGDTTDNYIQNQRVMAYSSNHPNTLTMGTAAQVIVESDSDGIIEYKVSASYVDLNLNIIGYYI